MKSAQVIVLYYILSSYGLTLFCSQSEKFTLVLFLSEDLNRK